LIDLFIVGRHGMPPEWTERGAQRKERSDVRSAARGATPPSMAAGTTSSAAQRDAGAAQRGAQRSAWRL